MKFRILLSSGEWHAALACVESLGRKGHQVDVMSQSRWAPAASSRYASKWISVCSEYDGSTYLDFLWKALQHSQYDLFIPISDRAIDLANAHRQLILSFTQMILPSHDAIILARDKAQTMRLAERLDVPIPRTLFPQSLKQAVWEAQTLGFPCVLKTPRGTGSKGVLIAKNEDEVRCFVEKYGRDCGMPILQEHRPGDTADLAAVCHKGTIIASHSFYCEPRHMIGGTPPYVTSIHDERILQHANKLVESLDWSGPIDFDFIRTADGECLLLEINPRFSGTISFASAVGIDLPQALLDTFTGIFSPNYGGPPPNQTRFRTGLEFELQWWGQDPLHRSSELLSSWADRLVLHVNRLSDPSLLAAQIFQGLRKAIISLQTKSSR